MAVNFSIGLDPALDAPHAARRHVAKRLPLPTHVAEHVEVVVSELVTNAVLHGAPPIHLTVTLHEDFVHIEVHDAKPDMTLPTSDSRGLQIVRQLATNCGVAHTGPEGKSVWADLSTAEADEY